jgi:hypothetical protein
MALKLSFGDVDTERHLWEMLQGYCVEITPPGGPATDYEIAEGLACDGPDYTTTIGVRTWSEDEGRGVGDVVRLALTGDEEVMVY